MKPAAEAGELRRQTRGCAASMPLWHVNGEGRGETHERGCVCVLEGGGGAHFMVGNLVDKRLNLSGTGYPLGTSVNNLHPKRALNSSL